MAPGVDHGMVRNQIPGVPDDAVAVPHPPRKFDALMGVEEGIRPPARALEDLSRNGDGTLPHAEHSRRMTRITLVHAGDPAGGVGPRLRVGDAGLDQAEPGVGSEHLRHAQQGVRFGKPGVVIEEEDHGRGGGRDSGVAAGRDPDVLGQSDRPNPLGKPGGLPSVADHDDVGRHTLLGEDGP